MTKTKTKAKQENGQKPTIAEVRKTLLAQRDQGKKNIQALSLELAKEKEYLLRVLGGIEVLERVDGVSIP